MLSNLKSIVTGGTKGIGAGIATELLQKGAKVTVIYSSDEDAAKAFEENNRAHKERLWLKKGSIGNPKFIKTAIEEAHQQMGGLNLTVNNAGITKDNLFLDMTEDEWQKVIEINLGGTLETSLASINKMLQNTETSYIINLASISGLMGRASQTNYATSKGGIIGLAKLLGKKHYKNNIHIHTIVPGIIQTPMVEKMPENLKNEILSATTAKKAGTPAEIASIVCAIVSGQMTYTVGNVIRADGGLM